MGKLWGGRFSKETDDLVDGFNASIGFDVRLWEHDIRGSIAHAEMLGKCGIIPEADSKAIVEGLKQVRSDIESGKAEFDLKAEDIHMNVEKMLHDKIGDAAGKLHTARSRNDQVALDMRMYVKEQIGEISDLAKGLQEVLISIAEKNVATVIPGYTHMQHAQPVSLAHHLLAYVWMLQRDRERLSDCFDRADVMPLGSGALAGTSFPIDREYVASKLGFSKISENSMDAVSDRDFALEFLSDMAILGVHLSRLAEEIIIWNTREFGFIELDDSMATGSSIMPQKKNPDVAELVRGKTGRLIGNLVSLMTVLKGLPLSYNKDMQEDKEPVFDSVDTLTQSIPVLTKLIETMTFKTERMKESMMGDFSNATDLADALVRQGMPFRKAHEEIGELVRSSAESKDEDLEGSVEARDIPGATSAAQIKEQIQNAKKNI